MGRIIELIKSFINPKEEEKSFDELALEAGMSQADIAVLKNTMEGVSWAKYVGEENEGKKRKAKRAIKAQPEIEEEAFPIAQLSQADTEKSDEIEIEK